MQKLSFGHKIWYYEARVCAVYGILPSKIRLLGQAPSWRDYSDRLLVGGNDERLLQRIRSGHSCD
jgi:hypothetical protein